MIYVIGCGGVGCRVVPEMCLLTNPDQVTAVDGDLLEEGNLDRQLFDRTAVGKNKADALAEKFGCRALPRWYSSGEANHQRSDWLIVCVDNWPARREALESCDLFRCRAVFAANETHSAEAYAYLPEWKWSNLDPRMMYPQVMAVHQGDPRAAAIGCTGEAQRNNRQLSTANQMAAALAMHLYVVHALESRKLKPETRPHLPHKLVNNLSKSESFKAILMDGATMESTNNE